VVGNRKSGAPQNIKKKIPHSRPAPGPGRLSLPLRPGKPAHRRRAHPARPTSTRAVRLLNPSDRQAPPGFSLASRKRATPPTPHAARPGATGFGGPRTLSCSAAASSSCCHRCSISGGGSPPAQAAPLAHAQPHGGRESAPPRASDLVAGDPGAALQYLPRGYTGPRTNTSPVRWPLRTAPLTVARRRVVPVR